MTAPRKLTDEQVDISIVDVQGGEEDVTARAFSFDGAASAIEGIAKLLRPG